MHRHLLVCLLALTLLFQKLLLKGTPLRNLLLHSLLKGPKLGHAPMKRIRLFVRFTDKLLQLVDMAAHTLDDLIAGTFQLSFELFCGYLHILVFPHGFLLLIALPAYKEHHDHTNYDEESHDLYNQKKNP